MYTNFSKVGAGLCASLVISFYFCVIPPARAADSKAEPGAFKTSMLEPGRSREAQAQRDALRDAQLNVQTSSAGVSASSVQASTAPDKLEVKVDDTTTYGGEIQQANDDSGRAFVTWLDTRDGGGGRGVYFARSLDEGETWHPADRIDRNSGTGTATYVDIATDNFCNVYIGWIDTRDDADGQIFFVRSSNCGETWTTPKKLSSASSAQDPSFDMAVGPNGKVFIVWGDNRNDSLPLASPLYTQVFSLESNDYGATWNAEKRISDPTSNVSDDYTPVVVWTPNGDLIVSWISDRNAISAGDEYDYYSARSSDDGRTWTTDTRLNTESAGTQDISSFGLCADHEHVYAVYQTKPDASSVYDVRMRDSHDFGTTFSSAMTLNGSRDTSGLILSMACAGDRAIVAFDAAGSPGDTIDDVRVAATTDGGHTWSSANKVDKDDPSNSGFEPGDITTTITPAGDAIVAYTDQRQGISTSEGFYNHSEDGGISWLAHDIELTSIATVHNVSMSRELGTMLSTAMDAEGASDDHELNAWITFFDNRTGDKGIFSTRLNFARAGAQLDRLSGDNRLETAIMISQDSFPASGSVSALVVATSEDFPDGLAGGPLAVMVGGPLLITPSDNLNADVAAEIARLYNGQDDAETDVYVLGGGSALSVAVEAAIAAIDPTLDIERLEGADRIGTALAIANKMNDIRGHSPSGAMLAYGRNFPDALSASAPAASSSVNSDLMPILLAEKNSLDPRVASFLTDNAGAGLLSVSVIGGTSVISDAVLAAVDDIVVNATRYGGVNRYDTAAILNSAMFSGPSAPISIGIASGENFPDALTGGAHSGRMNRPLVLVRKDSVPSQSQTYIEDNDGTITTGDIYGGTAAISDAVKTLLEAMY